MPSLRTSLSQFSLVEGRRRNHTDAIACRQPSRRPFGPGRANLYLLAEHAAANGQEHRFCQVVMREVQLAFAAEEEAGTAAALTRALMLVNRNLWQGGQDLAAHKRLPIGLAAVAIDDADVYLCQIATGQIFVTRGEHVAGLPSFDHWRGVLDGSIEASTPLGQAPDISPRLMRCRLAPGDRIVLASTNLARLIDRDTLAALAAGADESPVAGLCRLAEDYGLLNTCGLTIEVTGSTGPATALAPLLLEPVPLDELVVVPTIATGLVGRLTQAVRRTPAPLPATIVPEVATPHATPLVATPAPAPAVEERLPDNMVRLYQTPPMAPAAESAPVAAAAVADDAVAPAVYRPVRQLAPRSWRARWLDALAASMVVASDTLRRPPAPAPRSIPARRGASGRPVEAAPEPVYRASGKLSPAGAGGFAIPSVAAIGLRWPLSGLNSALVIAMVVVAALLALVARQTVLAPREAIDPTGGALPAAVRDATQDRPALVVATVSDIGPAPTAVPVVVGSVPVNPDAPDRAGAGQALATAATGASAAVVRNQLSSAVVLAEIGAGGTPATTPKQLIVGRGNVYVLDPYTSTLYLIDSSGKSQTTLLARGWSISKEKVLDLLGVTWRGDTLVVMDRKRAYTLDGPSGTWRVAPLAAAGLGAGVHQVASYDGGLYVLDSARGQVLKFAQGAYQKAPQPWLKSVDTADLAGAVDLAIDGRIYALTASGQLVTLLRGEVERRQAIAASPPLQSPAALVSPPNSPYLYIAEASGRVLKLTKDGNVVSQYTAAGSGDLANLSSFWVDEATQTIYAVAGNKVVRVGLPEPGRTRLALS